MNEKNAGSLARLQRQLQQRWSQLGGGGLISQGSVQDRTQRQGGGAGYQWTRKVGSKTVTVALTADQYRELKLAIANYRRLRRQLADLEKFSRQIIFEKHPNPRRRKKLSRKVLGLN